VIEEMVYRSRIFRNNLGKLKPGVLKNARYKKGVLNKPPINGYSEKTKKDATFIDNNVQDIQYFIRTHYISDRDLR
jgi:hypothetical protein